MDRIAPLASGRVIDCSARNGIFGSRLLADGGADVVRVVPPAGDPIASEPPFFGGSGLSIQAAWYNAGKRVASIDLATSAGRAQLLGLMAEADILVEDWQPGRAPLTDAACLRSGYGPDSVVFCNSPALVR